MLTGPPSPMPDLVSALGSCACLIGHAEIAKSAGMPPGARQGVQGSRALVHLALPTLRIAAHGDILCKRT